MIGKLGQVMIYVNNQEQAVKFWTEKVGFQLISENKNEVMRYGTKSRRQRMQKQASYYTIKSL